MWAKIKEKYLNTSARKIKNKYKISVWKKKGVVNIDGTEINTNQKTALIIPDGDTNGPVYLIFYTL